MLPRSFYWIVFLLLLTTEGYSQFQPPSVIEPSKEVFYLKTSVIYSKFFVRVREKWGRDSFSQEWEYRPSGVLMIGLNRSIGLSKWAVFGEIGALAHRSKYRYAVHTLRQLVVIAEFGTTRKLEKLRLSTSIWGASLPESDFSLASAPFTSAEANKFWVGIAARASYACSPKVFINTGFHYGSTIYEDSIRSITGSSYGETLHRPGWMELGVILFL